MIWGLVAMVIAGIFGMVLIALAPEGDVAIDETEVIAPILNEEQEWAEFNELARIEYADEFTALFNSYETKRAKNGRLMIRQGDSGSFKFAKKG